jgi:hypothetical protein
MTTVPVRLVRAKREASRWVPSPAAALWLVAWLVLLLLAAAVAAGPVQDVPGRSETAGISAGATIMATGLRFMSTRAVELGSVFNKLATYWPLATQVPSRSVSAASRCYKHHQTTRGERYVCLLRII